MDRITRIQSWIYMTWCWMCLWEEACQEKKCIYRMFTLIVTWYSIYMLESIYVTYMCYSEYNVNLCQLQSNNGFTSGGNWGFIKNIILYGPWIFTACFMTKCKLGVSCPLRGHWPGKICFQGSSSSILFGTGISIVCPGYIWEEWEAEHYSISTILPSKSWTVGMLGE